MLLLLTASYAQECATPEDILVSQNKILQEIYATQNDFNQKYENVTALVLDYGAYLEREVDRKIDEVVLRYALILVGSFLASLCIFLIFMYFIVLRKFDALKPEKSTSDPTQTDHKQSKIASFFSKKKDEPAGEHEWKTQEREHSEDTSQTSSDSSKTDSTEKQ